MDTETEPRKLVEYARDRLREAILTNVLPASASFSQVQLARELGISRTPLREAVRLLEYEGLATVNFNKRVTVSALSPEDLDSLYSTRILIESLAIHAKVANMDQAFLATSRARLVKMEAAAQSHDFDTWSSVHREFHLALTLGVSARVDQQIEHYFDHAQRYRHLYVADSDVNWNRSSQEHEALQAACETGDRAAAARLLAEHYASTATGVLSVFAPGYVPALINSARTMAKSLIFAP